MDMNNNSKIEFNEFQDIRRNFYDHEAFIIAVGLYSLHPYSINLTIYEQLNGRQVYSQFYSGDQYSVSGKNIRYKNGKVKEMMILNIPAEFSPGIYTYNISLKYYGTELYTYSDKFQILSKDEKFDENLQNTSNPSSSSNTLDELIKLLKEGKISEETFKISMEALTK